MINNFERWCYRRMLRISWTEHVTIEKVSNMASTKPTLLDGLLTRRMDFHGHLVRKGGITLDLMIGRLHGTRPRGRPRTTWLKDLTTQTNISYKEAITIPRDRNKWRSVGNPRRTPDEWVSEWCFVIMFSCAGNGEALLAIAKFRKLYIWACLRTQLFVHDHTTIARGNTGWTT